MNTNTHRPPPRVVDRPDPVSWSGTEPITLPEAIALRWPRGPLTVKSLRTAIRRGQLAHVRIARKLFTNLDALEEMCRCTTVTPARPDATPETPTGPTPDEIAALLTQLGVLKARPARGTRPRP